jgi:SAM-dependent methyltransferase
VALRRRCPVCAGGRARPLWREHRLRYVRCADCATVFSDVDEATYDDIGHNTWHDEEISDSTVGFYGAAREVTHRHFLTRFPPHGAGRLLDVGCGLGYFVAAAQAAGWDGFGCDTSEPWVRRARSLAGAERISLGPVEPGLFGGEFDLITSWDVLEHIHDPLPFLNVIASLLAPGGRAFLRTPNLTWIYPTYAIRRGLLGSPVELGPLNHVVYYTAATLTDALRRAGLEPIAWPVLPPPQVGIGNRDPSQAGRASAVTRAKNLHAASADRLASISGGRLVLGQDLDVVATRAR